ncbi:GAF domain-containing protein [Rhodococcus aerolatus]
MSARWQPGPGWVLFEVGLPGSEKVMLAGDVAYEARSPLRVLGKADGPRYQQLAREAAAVAERIERPGPGDVTVIAEPYVGPSGAVHAVAVWAGAGDPPALPPIDCFDIDYEKRTSKATGALSEVWADGRKVDQEYSLTEFTSAVHPDDVVTMVKITNDFVGAEAGTLGGLRWSVKKDGGWAPLQSYGRLVYEDGSRIWRGHSLAMSTLADAPTATRSLFGELLAGGRQQVAVMNLAGPWVIRWMYEGLPEVAWPADGDLNATIDYEQSPNPFDRKRLEALDFDEDLTTELWLKTTAGESIRTTAVAHIVDEPTSDLIAAIVRLTPDTVA